MEIGFHVIDTQVTKGFLHDASRPFIVVEIYRRGYKGGNASMWHGRYTTRAQAMRRKRDMEKR